MGSFFPFVAVGILISLRQNPLELIGLENLFYVLVKWATFHGLLKERLTATHLCMLFIQFGLGLYAEDKNIMQAQFLEEVRDFLDLFFLFREQYSYRSFLFSQKFVMLLVFLMVFVSVKSNKIFSVHSNIRVFKFLIL